MIWYRLVFLLLLPLGLGGCWEHTARSSSTAPYTQGRFADPGSDDLPTPRFFQMERNTGGPE
jgi:hypothetical protein